MYFFDLDGTLLDSNGVWLDIDVEFLGRFGIGSVPEDYTDYVTHHGFDDSARYTRDYFRLPLTPEEIISAWREMARSAYAGQLELKPGARGFLERARASGIPRALLTSCIPSLCSAALEHHRLLPLLDRVFTAAGWGWRSGTRNYTAWWPGCAAWKREIASSLTIPPSTAGPPERRAGRSMEYLTRSLTTGRRKCGRCAGQAAFPLTCVLLCPFIYDRRPTPKGCRPPVTIEKVALPLFREKPHARCASIPSGKVGPPCVRGVISDAHVAGNDEIKFYSVACGRRNSLQEGFFYKLRRPAPKGCRPPVSKRGN